MENKNTLTVILAIGLVLVSLFLIYQSKTTEIKTINVDGSYLTKVDPDQAEITFRVITRADTAIDAQKKNSVVADKLVKALKEAGLSEKEIQTTDYYSNRRSIWENNSYVEKGFEVTNSIRIITKSIDKIGKFIDIASASGVENIDSLSFTISEEKKEELYQEALSKAGENARERADKLGESIGFKVKRVKSVSLNMQTPIYYGGPMLLSEKDVAATPIQPKAIDLDATVNVVFEIG